MMRKIMKHNKKISKIISNCDNYFNVIDLQIYLQGSILPFSKLPKEFKTKK